VKVLLEFIKFWVLHAMLYMKSQWKKREGVLPQLPIVLSHVKEQCFFITQVKVVLHAIINSKFSIM